MSLLTDKMACRGSTLDHAEERYYAAERNEPTPEEYLTMLESWIIDQLCRLLRQQVEVLLRVSSECARERAVSQNEQRKTAATDVACKIACRVNACWTNKCTRHIDAAVNLHAT